jgi:1-acyl-sn-glycerol-3-phosphate acyltransferase
MAPDPTSESSPGGVAADRSAGRIAALRRLRSWLTGLVRFLLRLGLTAVLRLLIRIEVKGLANIPAEGPFILAPNHCSHLDGALLVLALSRRRRVRLAAAKDYFFNRSYKSWFFHHVLDLIPFDRGASNRAGLRLCMAALTGAAPDSSGLIFFPEGTRSRDGGLQPFKPGLGLLAVETGTAVVPAALAGTFPLMPRGRYWPRPGRVRIAFGPVLSPPVAAAREPLARRRQLWYNFTRAVEEAVQKLATDFR